ncbi:MAG: Ig-like domain-containing protein, partial [Planctomycetota bacterium]
MKNHSSRRSLRVKNRRLRRRRSLRPQFETLEQRQMLAANPVAGDDVYALQQDTPVLLDFLVLNDSDPDGDPILITGVTDPANGNLVADGFGGFTYTPNAGYVGDDVFTYTLSDGVDGTDTGQVIISVNAALDAEATRDAILDGVTVLKNPTQPGRMVVYGPTAISVSNYPNQEISQPMIAAATMGAGRMIAVPDHQWLNLSAFGTDASMQRFYGNGIGWLADSNQMDVNILVFSRSADADWLTARGYTNVSTATAGNLATSLANADVLVGWLGSNLSTANQAAIEAFVKSGGGLMLAEYGVGYQWWWNRATDEIPTNALLRDAGIGFTQEWPASSMDQSINRADEQLTSEDLIRILRDPDSATDEEIDLFGVIYKGVNDVLPDGDILQSRLDAEFDRRIQLINPTPATPVTDTFEKALLTQEMTALSQLPVDEVTKHRTADAVYGAIPDTATRLQDQRVTVDSNITGMIATGLYAPAGEIVTLTLPAAIVGQGYSIRISGNADNISGRGSWNRVPFGVQRRFTIDSENMQIASAFGGQIYIDWGGQAGGTVPGLGDQEITISGAVASPHFVLGETTDQEWMDTIRNHPAPYAELVSERLAIAVPSQWVRDLDNPTALMEFWNETLAFQDWVGGFENTRTGPDRINYDVQISVGLLHAGYPTQGPVSYGDRIVSLDELQANGDWGWFHEMGHELQRHPELGWGTDNPWTFPGDVEVTVNIFANAALERSTNFESTSGWGYSAYPELVMQRALDTINNQLRPSFEDKDPYPFYFQLADGAWGWQGYRDVLSTYVDDQLNNPGNLPSNGAEEKDQWLIRWSREMGHDMTQYMVDHWQLEVSQAALDAVAAMDLPGWMPLAMSNRHHVVLPGQSVAMELNNWGLSLDRTATLIGISDPANGAVTDEGGGNYTYLPNDGFVGVETLQVTYQSSAGNQQTFDIVIDVTQSGALLETFLGISGSTIDDLRNAASYPDAPSRIELVTDFESPTNIADQYGARMRAYITAPTSGDYTLWIAADDQGSLLLSTDSRVENATEIASAPSWTSSRQWDKYVEQQSETIALVEGQRYYIEAIMKEGGGGDNLAVAWAGPTIDGPTVIGREHLLVFGTVINDPPIAVDDDAETAEDTGIAIDVLQNDSDPDDDALTITGFTQPDEGTVSENANGTLQYQPNADFHGSDSFTYTIGDGNDNFATATVTVDVTPVNDAPDAIDDVAETDEEIVTFIYVLENDVDVDGDDLTITSFTQGQNGAVSANADGSFRYVPTTNFHGTDVFTYTISDGNDTEDTASVTVTVNPINDAPEAHDDTAESDEDVPVDIAVLANDSDIDGDMLHIESFFQGESGDVTDNGDGTLKFTPHENFHGTDSFSYTIGDGNEGSATATVIVTINAVNDAPDAVDDIAETDEDTPVDISILENDSDVEEDPLNLGGFTQPANGVVNGPHGDGHRRGI